MSRFEEMVKYLSECACQSCGGTGNIVTKGSTPNKGYETTTCEECKGKGINPRRNISLDIEYS